MKAYRAGMGYVSDLPGYKGVTRVKVGSERNSDWGYTNDSAKAIDLSVYWQRRFVKYLRDIRATGELF